jgi:hypothetical protein
MRGVTDLLDQFLPISTSTIFIRNDQQPNETTMPRVATSYDLSNNETDSRRFGRLLEEYSLYPNPVVFRTNRDMDQATVEYTFSSVTIRDLLLTYVSARKGYTEAYIL